jgi:hypothetical protein
MIHIVKTPNGDVHPAVVVSPTLAIPLYEKPWGVCSKVTGWQQAGLHRPSYAVLSQPWRSYQRRRHLGSLSFEDRVRMVQAAVARPELLPELRDTL